MSDRSYSDKRKLAECEIRRIQRMREAHASYRTIQRELGVAPNTISRYAKKKQLESDSDQPR